MVYSISDQFLDAVRWNSRPLSDDENTFLWENTVKMTFTKGEGRLLTLPGDAIYLERFDAITPRHGHGTLALAWMTGIATDTGTTIYLDACADNREKDPSAQERLVGLYQKFGFDNISGNLMSRSPNTPQRSALLLPQ